MSDFLEPDALNSVAAFHRVFDLPVVDAPIVPSEARCHLRISLIKEELDELVEAIKEQDIIKIADAFSDLQYVLSGAILEFGLGGRFKALFDEVQRSNMSKTCKTLEEAHATVDYYQKEKNMASYIVPKGHEYLVYRKEDGKVLKSVNYSPPDFVAILGIDN